MPNPYRLDWFCGPDASCWGLYAGSRSRWLTPEADNFGFAAWVKEHAVEFRALGPGRHFGEWWGRGINRGYGQLIRWFSLFNVSRWDKKCWFWDAQVRFDREQAKHLAGVAKGKPYPAPVPEVFVPPPSCCLVVPVLMPRTAFNTSDIYEVLALLQIRGSTAAPGFMLPEGVVVFHTASGHLYKITLDNDQQPKGES
jgi:hypothetical protein